MRNKSRSSAKKEKAAAAPSSSTVSSSSAPALRTAAKLSQQEENSQIALKHIQSTIEIQEARLDEIQAKIKVTIATAKEKLEGGNKRAAVRSMKKVKLYQVELNKVAAAIDTLKMQTMSIESSLNHMEVLKAMQEGSDAMKKT